MERLRILVTGASGFLGSHLVRALVGRHDVMAVARSSPSSRRLAVPEADWQHVDLTSTEQLRELHEHIREVGGVDVVVHLAAYYDFTGVPHPDYQRVNVDATVAMLELAADVGATDFVLGSSVAACEPPSGRGVLDEASPTDGWTPYAVSKRRAERIVRGHEGPLRTWIVRFGAVFSDWAEYQPLYEFLETWLGPPPRNRLVAGRGTSAIPFLHVRDAVAFLLRLLELRAQVPSGEVLLASPDDCTSHLELFAAATSNHFGERSRPILVPRPLCVAALTLRERARRWTGSTVFERPWMGAYIDRSFRVDAERTRDRLGWAPRARLGIERRMPFLIQHRKSDPGEWHRRNHASLRAVRLHTNLLLYRRLEEERERLIDEVVNYVREDLRQGRFEQLSRHSRDELAGLVTRLLDRLVDSVRTGDKQVFRAAARDLVRRHSGRPTPADELSGLLHALGDAATLALAAKEAGPEWELGLLDHVTMTVQFGVDEIADLGEPGP